MRLSAGYQRLVFLIFLGILPGIGICRGEVWAQNQKTRPPVPLSFFSTGEIQTDRLLEQYEKAATDQERFRVLTQLITQHQYLSEDQGVLEIYEKLLDLPQMRNPETHFRWALQVGEFFRRQGWPDRTIGVYDRFLSEFNQPSAAVDLASFRLEIEHRRLSAMIQSGAYRQAKAVAFEILDASDGTVQGSLLESFLALAENDLLGLPEMKLVEELLFSTTQYQTLLPRLIRQYLNQGRTGLAIEALDRLLEENPGFFLSNLDVVQQAYELHFKEDAADTLLEKMDALEIQDQDLLIRDLIRVRWLDRMGRTGEAYALLESKPGSSEPYQKALADLYYEHRRYEDAAKIYERLCGMNSRSIPYLSQLGESYYRKGDRPKAIEVWERIPGVQGQTSVSFQTLAQVYQSHGLYREAIEALKQAKKQSGAQADLNLEYQILDLWIELGDDATLIKEYLQMALLNSNREPQYRARITEQMTDPSRAKKLQAELEKRLETDVDETRRGWLRQLGTDLWISTGQYSQAVQFVKTVYAGSPELGLQLYRLGLDLERRGASSEAIEAWGGVPEGVAFYLQTRLQLAQISLRLGRYENARAGALDLVHHIQDRVARPLSTANSVRDSSSAIRIDLSKLQGTHFSMMIEALFVLAQVDLKEKRPGEALNWLLVLENHIGGTREGPLLLLFGNAYSQLGSLETAQNYYQRTLDRTHPQSSERSEAEFMLAECLLWQEKSVEAMDGYFKLVQTYSQGDYANDAIRRYIVLTFAGAQQLYHYSLASLFEWKGDTEEAIRLYREAASDEAEGDVAGWCLFEVARILLQQGEFDAAKRQIENLLGRFDHPTLTAECRVLLARLPDAAVAGDAAEATGPYMDLLLQYPNTIYSDLSRLKLEGRLEQPF